MRLKLLCPNESLFSKKNLNFKKILFKFKNLSQKEFNTIAHDYEIILMRFSLDLKYRKKTKIKYIISPTTGLNHIDNQIQESKKSRYLIYNKIFK